MTSRCDTMRFWRLRTFSLFIYMSVLLMVIGAFLLIWSINSGISDPREHMTLPYLVQANTVPDRS